MDSKSAMVRALTVTAALVGTIELAFSAFHWLFGGSPRAPSAYWRIGGSVLLWGSYSLVCVFAVGCFRSARCRELVEALNLQRVTGKAFGFRCVVESGIPLSRAIGVIASLINESKLVVGAVVQVSDEYRAKVYLGGRSVWTIAVASMNAKGGLEVQVMHCHPWIAQHVEPDFGLHGATLIWMVLRSLAVRGEMVDRELCGRVLDIESHLPFVRSFGLQPRNSIGDLLRIARRLR